MAANASGMTIVRMKVAKSEPTFSTPILAKMAVRAAEQADRMAHSCHERMLGFIARSYASRRISNRPRNRPATGVITDGCKR